MELQEKSVKKNRKTSVTQYDEEDCGAFEMDDQHLIKKLPEEIWQMVFKQLTPDDLIACSNASPYFRQLLYGQRVIFLFPKLINILIPTLKPGRLGLLGDAEGRPRDSNDRLKAKWKWLASLRLVCTGWNKHVEHICQSPSPTHFLLHNDKPGISSASQIVNHIKCEFNTGVKRPVKFVRHFESSHFARMDSTPKNPIITRSVIFKDIVIKNLPTDQMRGYMNGIGSMLRRYGREIWYCTIHVVDASRNASRFYSKLKSWLKLMPNLRALELNYKGPKRPSPLHLFDLEERIKTDPLPCLSQLEMLKIFYLPTQICNELIKRNSITLSQLQIWQAGQRADDTIYKVPLPNLKRLSMSIWSTYEFEMLEKFARIWQLEYFEILYGEHVQFTQWSRVFNCIQNSWSQTLKELVLQLPTPNNVDEMDQVLLDLKTMKLNFPNVKRLNIFLNIHISLDFILLPLKDSLECLEVVFERNSIPDHVRYQSAINEQHVQVLGFENRMIQSNIWSVLCKLKNIKIQVFGNNRHMSIYGYVPGKRIFHKTVNNRGQRMRV